MCYYGNHYGSLGYGYGCGCGCGYGGLGYGYGYGRFGYDHCRPYCCGRYWSYRFY
ncbi:keratin-associated protein 20-2-like [Peromyscus californicus insignis]|uniref:keratin-associated protein 20-2-like n=1 Tax=Peromyscus californicus insignis TaxID=564181 RepID=UPI0022A80AEC|nr:keratin-associated protein 20-2-like [Peromyscus californicus insignis]